MRSVLKITFFVPFIFFNPTKIIAIEKECIDILGVYVGAPYNPKKIFNNIPQDANCVVIDIKDDEGNLTYTLDDPELKYHSNHKISETLSELKKKNIYTIARIVAFKDKIKTQENNSYAICNQDGSLYVDKEKMSWLDPYNEDVHDYLIKIGILSIQAGFDEVQYDYIRFSNYKTLLDTNIKEKMAEKSREEIILEFIKKASDAIHTIGGKISVDVFGCVIPFLFYNWKENSKILGQNYVRLAELVDYVCPMLYPSHFPYGFKSMVEDEKNGKLYAAPDLQPYEIIDESLKGSNKAGVSSEKIRPWLQGFSASYLKKGKWKYYKKKEVQDQLNAVVENGMKQACIWHPRGVYKNM